MEGHEAGKHCTKAFCISSQEQKRFRARICPFKINLALRNYLFMSLSFISVYFWCPTDFFLAPEAEEAEEFPPGDFLKYDIDINRPSLRVCSLLNIILRFVEQSIIQNFILVFVVWHYIMSHSGKTVVYKQHNHPATLCRFIFSTITHTKGTNESIFRLIILIFNARMISGNVCCVISCWPGQRRMLRQPAAPLGGICTVIPTTFTW